MKFKVGDLVKFTRDYCNANAQELREKFGTSDPVALVVYKIKKNPGKKAQVCVGNERYVSHGGWKEARFEFYTGNNPKYNDDFKLDVIKRAIDIGETTAVEYFESEYGSTHNLYPLKNKVEPTVTRPSELDYARGGVGEVDIKPARYEIKGIKDVTVETKNSNKKSNEIKGGNIMKNNSLFGGIFGGVASGLQGLLGSNDIKAGDLAVSINGFKTAVNVGGKYFTYENGAYVDQMGMVLDQVDDMFFLMPKTQLAVGDIVLLESTYWYVENVTPNSITAVNFGDTPAKMDLVLKKNLLNIQFYPVVTNLMSVMGNQGGAQGLGSIILMSKLAGNGGNGLFGGDGLGQIMQMSMLSNLFGGANGGVNPLGGLGDMFSGITNMFNPQPQAPTTFNDKLIADLQAQVATLTAQLADKQAK